MNIINRHITKLAFILTITAFVIGFSSCNQTQQVVKSGTPEIDTSIPMQERDHVWVVDQNGVEVPVPGTCITHAFKFHLHDRREFYPTTRRSA